jgi:hypothetical protein
VSASYFNCEKLPAAKTVVTFDPMER